MYGARAVLANHTGAAHFEKQLDALESAVLRDPGLAFDLCKALVESVCKTVLRDRGQAVDGTPDLPRIFRNTLTSLRLVPDDHAGSHARESIRRTVGALQGVISGLAELRNTEGWVSHGKDVYTVPLEPIQAELAARAADTIVSFIVQSHYGYAAPTSSSALAHGDNPQFNEYVDENNPRVEIFELRYNPSEVLFYVDQDAYRDLLSSFSPDVEESESHDQDEEEAAVPATPRAAQ